MIIKSRAELHRIISLITFWEFHFSNKYLNPKSSQNWSRIIEKIEQDTLVFNFFSLFSFRELLKFVIFSYLNSRRKLHFRKGCMVEKSYNSKKVACTFVNNQLCLRQGNQSLFESTQVFYIQHNFGPRQSFRSSQQLFTLTTLASKLLFWHNSIHVNKIRVAGSSLIKVSS